MNAGHWYVQMYYAAKFADSNLMLAYISVRPSVYKTKTVLLFVTMQATSHVRLVIQFTMHPC